MTQATIRWTHQNVRNFLAHARVAFRSNACVVRIAPKSFSVGRLLLVVPKQVGSAVERNRVKRRVRAAFCKHQLAKSNFDWGFFIKPAAVCLPYREYLGIIESSCKE
jgi:ribonuclease P protein component